MDKKIGTMGMAFTFAGCLLGAGYVSGQELWQYFGSYGKVGIEGLVISIALVGVIAALVFRISDRARTGTVDRLMIRWDIPWLRITVGVLFSLLYFVVAIIMISGISSLGVQIFGLPRAIGSAIATTLIMVTVYFGFQGLVRVFELVVPVLVAAAIALSVWRLSDVGTEEISLLGSDINPMLGPWYLSALNYTALNMFSSVGILAPLAKSFQKKRVGTLGVLLGSGMLIAIAALLILAMATDSAAPGADLPMLFIAQKMGAVPAGIYAALLFLAMYGNANATMVAALNYLDKRLPRGKEKKGRIVRIVLVGLVSYACSLTGFTNLVAKVYPVIGYIGAVSILLLAEHALHLAKEPSQSQGD